MKGYYSVEEISKKIGISRQKLTNRIKKLGFNTKKLGDEEFKAILYDCLDVLQGKKEQSGLLEADSSTKVKQTAKISNKSGSTIEQRLKMAKIELDFIKMQLEKEKAKILACGSTVKSSNGNSSQSSAMKTYNDLIKSFNIIDNKITDLELKLKLTSTSTAKAIDD